MIKSRRNAPDHVMTEVDERLEVNARTIAALGRAIELTREHLKVIELSNLDPNGAKISHE
jgi:hypothetical protein